MNEFHPSPGLRGTHVQSVLASFKPRRWLKRGHAMERASAARIIDCPDHVRLLAREARQAKHSRGLVAMLHGWEGSHDSVYLQAMACSLFDAGYDVLRLNLRDHGGTHHLNQGMFHSALIDEVIAAVGIVAAETPHLPLFVVGFSLGGNFALRVGLHGPTQGLKPELTIGICPAINPAATTRCLDTGAGLYRRYFLKKWRRTLVAKAAAWPDHYEFGDLLTLDNFQHITRLFAERHTPFGAVDAYFQAYTVRPEDLIDADGRFAVITAQDDPVVPFQDFQLLERQDSVRFIAPLHGGHCGFVENWRLNSWADQRVIELIAPLS